MATAGFCCTGRVRRVGAALGGIQCRAVGAEAAEVNAVAVTATDPLPSHDKVARVAVHPDDGVVLIAGKGGVDAGLGRSAGCRRR